MEKITILFYLVLISSVTLFAQSPELMNYQGVARDNQGNVLKDRSIAIQIKIHAGSAAGNVSFQENHFISTNGFGLFNFQIGSGTQQSGSFSAVDWGSNAYFAEILMDASGGTSFVSVGTQQLVSVPYALYAKNSGSNAVNGTQNYIAKFTPNGTKIGNSLLFDNGTNIGIGNTSPDDQLDVSGNSQISGYLKVGNPSIPSNASSFSPIPLYKLSYLSGTEAWSVDNACGDQSENQWYVDIYGSNSGLLYYGSQGSYNRSYTYSPWIWIPTGSSRLLVEASYSCYLEDGYDGVFLEYKIGGGNWTKISTFAYGGYTDIADGCNTSCNGKDPQNCWSGINDTRFFRVDSTVFPKNIYGKWIRFRFGGMEDSGTGSNYFSVNGFSVTAFGGTAVGGTFAQGNIYAEKNIYAGSNVLLGDVAEYFQIDGQSEPGDLISFSVDKKDHYRLSNIPYNPYILGIHSTNPTVTLNTPNGIPVCLTGRVPVKVSNENGSIHIGDFLTSASLPGYAMKAINPCFIIGRALENFDENKTGKILCMAETGWYNPSISSTNYSTGDFFLPKGNSSVAIKDPAINSASRVFVSFRDNAGSFWINNISEGSFSIQVERPSTRNIPFDYFVVKASKLLTNENNQVLPSDKYISPSADSKSKWVSNSDSRKKMELPEYSDALPPNLPPDPNTAWTWLVNTGYVKYDSE